MVTLTRNRALFLRNIKRVLEDLDEAASIGRAIIEEFDRDMPYAIRGQFRRVIAATELAADTLHQSLLDSDHE